MRISLRGAIILTAFLLCGRLWGQPPAKKPDKVDPRARQVLAHMAEVYRTLESFSARTNFYSETIPFTPGDSPFAPLERPKEDKSPVKPTGQESPPSKEESSKDPQPPINDPTGEKANATRIKMPRSIRFLFMRPNRFRLELKDEIGDGAQPLLYQWVCDGKEFFTTLPERNFFTREKAPTRLADFVKVERMNLSSWDVLMVLGVNPFENLEEIMDTVQYGGTETIRKVETEVVIMRWASPQKEVEYRFYVGKADGLLRRVIQEELPITGPPEPGKVGDALDELADVAQPQPIEPPASLTPEEKEILLQPPSSNRPLPHAFKTRIIYDYSLERIAQNEPDPFVFTPPKDAWLYGPVKPKKLKLRDYKALRGAILKRYGIDPNAPANPK